MAIPAMRIAGDGDRAIPRKTSLTKTFIERLVCPAGQRALVVYDDTVRGLCVHITKTNRSFYVYRKSQGRPIRYRLGAFPELSVETARKMAMKDIGQIVQGIDPREERKAIRKSATLEQLFEQWEREYAKPRYTAKTLRTDKSRFDTCFADWKSWKIGAIREHHVRAKHIALTEKRGKTTANRAVQLLRRMLNFARVNPNPAGNRAVRFHNEQPRARFLKADELPRFFVALANESNETLRDFFYVSLLTGARRSNVQSMRWDEIDMVRSTWTIPGDKSKNRESMQIHLAEEVKTILKVRQGAAAEKLRDGDARYGEWVFPSKRFDAKTPHLTEPKSAWARILDRAKIKDLRVHDLRRSLGSWAAMTGASLPIIGKALGHLDQATTAIYARLQLDPVRASVNAATSAIMTAGQPKLGPEPVAKAQPKKNPRGKSVKSVGR